MVFGTCRSALFRFALASISLVSIQSLRAQDQQELAGPAPAAVDSIPADIEGYPSASVADTLFKYPQELIADQISCLQNEVPLSYNNTVQSFINYFTIRKRSYIRTMLSRKHIYFPLYESTLKKNNLPDELKYLSIVESGLNPRAVSRARAVGLWQFMSPTGREFGLQQDAYIDERMDPVKSTQAGCRYLQYLYNMFGDWELALAAYNCGPGNVRRAIRRSGNKTTFWDIYSYLPRETRSYVPMFVAVTYVMNHHKDYNIRPDSLQRFIAYDTIHVNQHLDLELFAKHLNVPLDDFKLLNPQLKRNVVPAHFKNYPLRVPQDALTLLADNRQAILDSAARTSPATAELLAAAETTPQRHASVSSGGRTKVTHRVTRGDALGKIADYYNVAVADIRKWNKLRGSSIRAGQRLAIWVQEHTVSSREEHEKPAPAKAKAAPSQTSSSLAKASTKGKVYRVQPGDTLWSISKGHGGISVERIKKMNKLRSNELKPGQRLILG
jgi:membrane-bound lytic murein transglycosylase D